MSYVARWLDHARLSKRQLARKPDLYEFSAIVDSDQAILSVYNWHFVVPLFAFWDLAFPVSEERLTQGLDAHRSPLSPNLVSTTTKNQRKARRRHASYSGSPAKEAAKPVLLPGQIPGFIMMGECSSNTSIILTC